MVVILFKSPTGNSGQMLYLYYGQLIINFIEVAIKERKEEWIGMQNSRLSLVKSEGRKKRNGIPTGLCTKQ